jgi:hypothetical protein
LAGHRSSDASRALLAVLLLALAATGTPPAAEAQSVDAGRWPPVEGPRLAGEDVVWIPAYRTDRFQVDIHAVAGGFAAMTASDARHATRRHTEAIAPLLPIRLS